MRVPVPLRRAYKLLNHGPTVLITSAAGGRRNVMAAAWVMALDFEPPKVAAVIAEGTYTRGLVRASGEFAINVPTVEMVEKTYAVGSISGRREDKFATYGLTTASSSKVEAPLVEGCAAWLECRVIPEPTIEERYDLLVAEVIAAWVDDALFVDGQWRFDDPRRRTIHHMAGGAFFATGERVDAGER